MSPAMKASAWALVRRISSATGAPVAAEAVAAGAIAASARAERRESTGPEVASVIVVLLDQRPVRSHFSSAESSDTISAICCTRSIYRAST